MNKKQVGTMLHKAVDDIINGWDVPEDEELCFFMHEDADTVQDQLQDLVDAVIYMAPIEEG